MRFTKTALSAGTFYKGGKAFHVSPEDLKTAYSTYQKIRESGYKSPVIMEHASINDKDGLPFEFKPQMSARDLAKYQEGWTDDLRLNSAGELEIDIDVRGKDGLKLITEVGTFISPQFGPWKHPKTGEVLPMAMTHFALTPFPVDVNQNPEFVPIQEVSIPQGTPVLEVSQMSQLVSFSLADLVTETDVKDAAQLSLSEWDESKVNRAEDGKFASGTMSGSGAMESQDQIPSPSSKDDDCHPAVHYALKTGTHICSGDQANQHGQNHWFNNSMAQKDFPGKGASKGYQQFGDAVQSEYEKRASKPVKSEPSAQFSQGDNDMPFPPKKPVNDSGDSDDGDVDQDDDGIVDNRDPDAGTGKDNPADEKVQDQLPDPDETDTWAQIGAALKLNGVIVPNATNPHALLAGLLTAAHHNQKAEAANAADANADAVQDAQAEAADATDPNQPVQPQNQSMGGQDPRLAGTRQEQAFTMSQAVVTPPANPVKPAANVSKTPVAPALPDLKTIPEFIQMSQANEALAAELSVLKREKYIGRIENLAKTGRIDKPEADSLKSVASTFQFSNSSSTQIAEMEMELRIREKLPEGAIWAPDERVRQLSIVEETRPGFFTPDGKAEISEADMDADIERRFGKFKKA